MKPEVDKILSERGEKYGPFTLNAQVSQRIKDIIFGYGVDKLSMDKKEALEMIAHKIARIICGDPGYADSWDDIAGYATLVANEIRRANDAAAKENR